MYLAGKAASEIARVHGVHATTVSRIAEAGGVLRSKSEGQAVRSAREGTGWDRIGKKGAVQSEKTGKWHPCDSAYEYARMIQLDADVGVLEWRRCERRIAYEFRGTNALYVPDIEVVLIGGQVRVEEVKPGKMVGTPKNMAKFAAAVNALALDGIQFQVITEQEIGWKEIRKYDGMGLNGVPDEDRAQRRRESALRHLHKMTPSQRAEYNRKAQIREAAKRAANRTDYNRKIREYRAAKNAKNIDSPGSLF